MLQKKNHTHRVEKHKYTHIEYRIQNAEPNRNREFIVNERSKELKEQNARKKDAKLRAAQ